MKELYQQTPKTALESLENQTRGVWYKDTFVKKIIVAIVVILAISVIAEIVFLMNESAQVGNAEKFLTTHP